MTRFGGLVFIGNLAKVFYPVARVSSSASKCGRRFLSSGSTVGENWKEKEIPILNGKISAKAWGSESAFPVLTLHGWMNNCGTFDRLIPLLTDRYYWFAPDLPGHGLSTHRPMGCVYSDFSMVVDVKRMLDQLGWKKFHVLGHSYGGRLGLVLASCFPDMIQKIMLLDTVKPGSRPDSEIPSIFRSTVNVYLKSQEKFLKGPKVISLEEAEELMKKETLGPDGVQREIEDNGVRVLLKRGLRKSDCGKGVVLTRDPRTVPLEWVYVRSDTTVENLMSGYKGELLTVLSNKIVQPSFQADTPEVTARYVELFKKTLKDKFIVERVDGTHFAHLNTPELVAPCINKFLERDVK